MYVKCVITNNQKTDMKTYFLLSSSKPLKKTAGSGSISKRHGSGTLDFVPVSTYIIKKARIFLSHRKKARTNKAKQRLLR
jgi:hypothetical protein